MGDNPRCKAPPTLVGKAADMQRPPEPCLVMDKIPLHPGLMPKSHGFHMCSVRGGVGKCAAGMRAPFLPASLFPFGVARQRGGTPALPRRNNLTV